MTPIARPALSDLHCPGCYKAVKAGTIVVVGIGHLTGPWCSKECWGRENEALAAIERRVHPPKAPPLPPSLFGH